MMARFTLFNMLCMESLVLVSFFLGGGGIWFGLSCIWPAGVSYHEKVLRNSSISDILLIGCLTCIV
jgi:hypothetical protein